MNKNKKQTKNQQPQTLTPVTLVFSKTRDIDVSNPYHLDGDLEMYSQEKIEMRNTLANDPDIKKQIQEIIKLYHFESETIEQQQYKRVQRQMALVLRPEIDGEELDFIVDQDWKLDQKEGKIDKIELGSKIFELVDVWTIGVEKQEYEKVKQSLKLIKKVMLCLLYLNQIYSMEEDNVNIKMNLIHAFGSTCSLHYNNDAIAICSEDMDQPRLIFPAGKTIASKSIQRHEMNFIHFDNTVEEVQCIHILPTRTHIATSQKPHGSNLRVVRIYSIKGNQPPQTIKIFHEKQIYGIIKTLIFSASQPKFMCCLVGQPYNKLIYIDISKNKPLAQSHFTMKDVDKITISPKNSHLICTSGQNSIKIFKVEEYAFKPLDDIKKLPRGRKFIGHAWYRQKMILAVTDKCEVLIIEQVKPNSYEVKQEYSNVFSEPNHEKITITAISTFSKGFILGSNNGKFCLWVRKQEMMNYEEQKLQLVRKWSTTQERASEVTGITVSAKQDLLAVSLLNNDIATISLNDLLPQVKEIQKEKISKQIVFEYVYKGFHNNNITGMDLCLQRPLLATCSNEDSTIRIWNYKNFDCKLLRMFYFRIKQISAKPLITLTFHPFGYYLAVGCVDKLRFFYVLSNQLRPYRQIGIKGAHIVKFSHGGNLIAMASPVKQDFPQEIIHVYNAITLEEIISFTCHQSTVKSLQWKKHDEYLCSISSEGIISEWRVSDWTTTKFVQERDLQFECFTYFNETNQVIAFAHKNGRKYLQQYKCQNSNFDEIQIDMKVVTMRELSINKRSVLLMGLENGSIIIFSIADNLKVKDIKSEHLKKVNQIRVSPCNRFVMTCGNDCMIFIYKTSLEINGLLQQQDSTSSTVDDFLADVVLFPKQQIKKYQDKERQLSRVLGNLERKLKYICEEGERKHQQKVQDLQIQKNRVIDDLGYRIERIGEQIETVKRKNQETLHDLDSKNFSQAQSLQEKYEEKINFEKQKFFQLQQQIIQEKMLHERKIQELRKDEKVQIEKIKSQFRGKFQQSQNIYDKSSEAVNEATTLFDQKIKQIQNEQQEQLKELQERLQAFKIQKAAIEEQLHQKLTKIKQQHFCKTDERNENKQKNEELLIMRKKMEKQLQESREKFRDLKGEYEQKIQTLKSKEEKIVGFEKKMQELQKKKHILSYKATQMKKALEPKQVQIEKLKLDLMKLKKEFDSSVQRKQNMVLFIQKIQKQKQYLEKETVVHGNELAKRQMKLDQLIYEIYNCVELNKNNPDGKVYSKEIIKLFHKYVQQNDKYQTSDQKGVQEMTKQIVHLQKSLYQINQSNDKNIMRKNDQINKRIKENAQLVNNLNQIKQENQESMRKIKAKNQDIERLRQVKTQMLTELKKAKQPLYQLSEDDDYSISQSRSNMDRMNKFSLIETIPKQITIEARNTIKKKECELVSEIQFLNEKIHKGRFFMKEIKDKIKKHFTLYKCAGDIINLQNDISQIK